MSIMSSLQLDPRMSAAVDEITALIRASYPSTTFLVDMDEDQRTVFITAVVDLDDPDEVIECFIDRILAMQIDEGLPLHVIPIRTPERRDRLMAEQERTKSWGFDSRIASG